jgi:hypothetical protein
MIAKHAVDFWLSTEDLPRQENRVTVDAQGTITLNYTPSNHGRQKQALREAEVDAQPARHARPPDSRAIST